MERKSDPEYQREYYLKHRDRRIALSRESQQRRAAERKEYMRAYYLANPDKFKPKTREQRDRYNATRRAKYAAEPERREKAKAAARDRDKDKKRDERLRKQFGISAADYDTILAGQGGGCAICGSPHGDGWKRRLHVDHCHTTGVVRGLLCSECNLGIGKLGDDPARLDRAALYLRACIRSADSDQ